MKKLAILSCLGFQMLLFVTFAAPSEAVVVAEYSELFYSILENLRTNYWSEDGNWMGDAQFDAAAFAPQILYRYGWEVGDPDLVDKANRTVDRNIDLFMEVLEGDTSNLTEAMIGAVSIPDAIRYYSGGKYADLPMEEMVWAGLREGKKIIREDPNPMGEYVGYLFPYGALAYAGFYYASIAKGIWGITAVPEALDVLRMANQQFWYREMIGEELASYYYDSSPYHWNQRMEAYGNGAILAALAKAYGVTRKREHRDRAMALLNTFDAHLWDRNRGGYGADLYAADWKALSINTGFLRAILDLYDVTGQPALLSRAREILEFIERDLLIDDPDHPGFLICSHDWIPFRGPTEYFCTGCNFAMLEGIFELNDLAQNGPTHPFPILVCGALPGEGQSTFQAAVYTFLLFLPGGWILLRRRGHLIQKKLFTAMRGRAGRARETTIVCLLVVVAVLLVAGCDTCVGVRVTLDRVPLEGAYVEILDEGGERMLERWTAEDGSTCFSGLPLGRTLTVKSTFDERSVEAVFQTGTLPQSCGTGLCDRVELSFSCEPPDPLEPNDSLYAASPVELPYSNGLAALCPQGDMDIFRLDLQASGMSLVADVREAVTGRWIYKRVGLFDPSGQQLDAASGLNVRVAQPLPAGGIYYLAVTHDDDYDFLGDHNQYGTYEIDIRLVHSSCVNVQVQQNGEPVPGAWVQATESPYSHCTTDAAGSCCFPAYQGVESGFEVFHPETWESLVVAVTPGNPGNCGEGNCEEVTVDFDYTCISGAVSRSGEPVEDAWVQGPYGAARSDPDGLYCILAPKNQDVSVVFEDPDLCVWHSAEVETLSDGSCTGGGCTALDMELTPVSCVSGTVTRHGSPVEGAQVYPSVGCWWNAVTTGPDGTFCVIVPANTELVLSVEDPLFGEYVEVQVQSGQEGSCAGGGCTEVEVALPGRTCVAGTVRWPDGEPAPDIYVWWAGRQARTSADGTYCLDVPEDRDVTIEFYDPVYEYYLYEDVRTGTSGSCGEGGCTPLDLVLRATGCVAGTLSRQGGQPPSGARVCLNWGELCVEPDSSGAYCIRAPADSIAWIRIDDPATETWEHVEVVTGAEGTCQEGTCAELDYELPPTACVSGVVTREEEPERGARVCLDSCYSGVFVTSGPDGEYCLPAGIYTSVSLAVEDPVTGDVQFGHVSTGAPGSCGEGNCASQDFALESVTCIRGVVRDGTEPLEGAVVENEFKSVFTNEEGRYCLPALSNDTRWIRARHPADNSEILRFPLTNNGGRCELGGCTTQNFTFD